MSQRIVVKREVELKKSARVLQIGSLFDVPIKDRIKKEWSIDVDLGAKDWNVGLIVGPSGCGKSTFASELFPGELDKVLTWDDRPVVDNFPKGMGSQDISGLLGSVGFNSPPCWMKPHAILSNGEKFRVEMARLLAESPDLAVVDEFTSVVDRQVAKIASHCVQKAVRKRGQKFVAVSCHEDVLDWLQPDWVIQPELNKFTWRSLRPRPSIHIEIARVSTACWKLFSQYHYLSGEIHVGAQCFGAFVEGKCVAFTSYLHFPHPKVKDIKHGHRLVVLPDYQGLGIGMALDNWLGEHLAKQGFRYRNVVAHPAMIASYSRDKAWKSCGMPNKGAGKTCATKALSDRHWKAVLRRSYAFEYVPERKRSKA